MSVQPKRDDAIEILKRDWSNRRLSAPGNVARLVENASLRVIATVWKGTLWSK